MRLTTKKFRMLLSALLCLLLLFSLSACTGSTKPLEIADGTCTIPGENLQFTIPENSFAFSAASSVFSEEWTLAGVTDPTSRVKEYEKMGTLANIISVGGNNNVFITKKQSSMTSEIFNMTESGDEAVAAVKADLEGMNETEGFSASVDETEINGLRYVTANVQYTPEEGQGDFMDEFCYVTIINGTSYTFDVYSTGDELTQEERDYLTALVNSASFTQILPSEVEPLSTKELLIALLPIVLLIALIVFLIVYSVRRKKKIVREKN